MTRKKMLYFILATVVVAVAYFGWKLTARRAYESAEYTVRQSDGAFEVREYPALMMATTNTRFQAQGDDGSFMRLFRYISGANDADRKVAMTTPVFMQPAVDDVPGQMGFVIPKKTVEQRIPAPVGGRVQIRERTGGRFAVIRFNGRLTSDSFTKAEGRLRNRMTSKELTGDANAESAGYDPPWTPAPLRRNEVLIRLQ
ncbi:MAG: heme-binding protein [Planctomycetes bacterium]|nr:heme-binding protein [Planctomycetota bacterium]